MIMAPAGRNKKPHRCVPAASWGHRSRPCDAHHERQSMTLTLLAGARACKRLLPQSRRDANSQGASVPGRVMTHKVLDDVDERRGVPSDRIHGRTASPEEDGLDPERAFTSHR